MRPEIFFDPDDSYIWDFVFDAEGNLYVSTGSSARIYKLPPDFQPGDEPLVWFKSEQTHLTDLAWDNHGNLLAGSSPQGILYRITGENEGFALYNSGAQEIKQISALDDGKIYFATFETKSGNGGSGSSSNATPSRSEEEPFIVTANSGFRSSSNGKKREKKSGPVGKGIIYSLDGNGFVEAYWGLPSAHIFAFIAQFNLFGNGHAIFCDGWTAPALWDSMIGLKFDPVLGNCPTTHLTPPMRCVHYRSAEFLGYLA